MIPPPYYEHSYASKYSVFVKVHIKILSFMLKIL